MQRGNTEVVQYLVVDGHADVNKAETKQGSTLLCIDGNAHVTQLATSDAYTTLCIAVEKGFTEIL